MLQSHFIFRISQGFKNIGSLRWGGGGGGGGGARGSYLARGLKLSIVFFQVVMYIQTVHTNDFTNSRCSTGFDVG